MKRFLFTQIYDAIFCICILLFNQEKELVRNYLAKTGRDIIDLSHDEIEHLAGNCLEVRSVAADGATKLHLAISSNGLGALEDDSRRRVEAAVDSLVVVDVPNIEDIGGGGIRCMLAANHLADRNQQ